MLLLLLLLLLLLFLLSYTEYCYWCLYLIAKSVVLLLLIVKYVLVLTVNGVKICVHRHYHRLDQVVFLVKDLRVCWELSYLLLTMTEVTCDLTLEVKNDP